MKLIERKRVDGVRKEVESEHEVLVVVSSNGTRYKLEECHDGFMELHKIRQPDDEPPYIYVRPGCSNLVYFK